MTKKQNKNKISRKKKQIAFGIAAISATALTMVGANKASAENMTTAQQATQITNRVNEFAKVNKYDMAIRYLTNFVKSNSKLLGGAIANMQNILDNEKEKDHKILNTLNALHDALETGQKIYLFNVNGNKRFVAFDSATEFTNVKPVLAEQFGISAESLSVLFQGSEIDDEMTFEDLDGENIFNIDVKGAPAPAPAAVAAPEKAKEVETRTYSVIMLLGSIPRPGTFKLPLNATTRDLEEAARKKWDLADIDIELATWEMDTDVQTTTGNKLLSEVDLSGNLELAIIKTDTGDGHAGAGGTAAFATTIAESVKPAAPAAATPLTAGLVQYNFNLEQIGKELSTALPPTATVKDAKAAVAAQLTSQKAHGFSGNPDDVTLLFSGKPLKDQWMMNRLRIGDKKISVVYKDTSDVLIVTAKANRGK